MILTVTFNPAVDHTVRLEKNLSDEKMQRTDETSFDAGGNGINVAEYLTALGIEAEATGPVGGFTGEFLKKTLTEEAVKTDFVETGGLTRMNETILAGEDEYKINQEGPELGQHVVEKVIEKVQEVDPELLLISGSLPPGLEPGDVDRVARNQDGDTAVDLHGDVLRQLEESYLFCKPNREELETATEMSIEGIPDTVEAGEKLMELSEFERVFVTLGDKGVVLLDEDRKLHASTPADADVVDTVGAGDAFVSGVLAAIINDERAKHALKTGTAVAMEVVSIEGTGMPELGDIEEIKEKVEIETL